MKLEQGVFPEMKLVLDGGTARLLPDVAISVEPGGIPAGRQPESAQSSVETSPACWIAEPALRPERWEGDTRQSRGAQQGRTAAKRYDRK